VFQLCDVSDDGFLSLMDDQGEIRDDVKVPEGDLGKEIQEKAKDTDNQFLVTILSALGEEAAIAIKNMPK